MFTQMLLDALAKKPPTSLGELSQFFVRSRERLENSLDKGGVQGEERDKYMADFSRSAEEAQLTFLNQVLGAPKPAKTRRNGGKPSVRSLVKLPAVWGAVAAALVVGLLIGLIVAG